MKLQVLKPVEIEVDAIRCSLAVNYEEEEIPNDFPGRNGETLDITFDLNTRAVRGWAGGARHMHLTVKDQGTYELLAGDEVIATRADNYVPDCLPQEYGDVVLMDIAADGTIANWTPREIDVALAFFPGE